MTDTTPERIAETVARLRHSHELQDGGPDACELGDRTADLIEAIAASLAEVEAERDRLEKELAEARTVQAAAGLLVRHLEGSCGTDEPSWDHVFRAMEPYTQEDRVDDMNALHAALRTIAKGDTNDRA